MTALLYGVIICIVATGEIYLVQYWDSPTWMIGKREKMCIPVCSAVNGILIEQIVRKWCMSEREAILLTVLAGCLLFACLTDIKECYVYQFVWWVAGVAGGVLLWSMQTDRIIPLLFYIILQELLFCRFYGRADCHAFAVCAVILCSVGAGMTEYLIHMILAFMGLTAVQVFRNNVNQRGCLKCPVAFLPYITLSFWVLLFF